VVIFCRFPVRLELVLGPLLAGHSVSTRSGANKWITLPYALAGVLLAGGRLAFSADCEPRKKTQTLAFVTIIFFVASARRQFRAYLDR